jgi:hypothetical protein
LDRPQSKARIKFSAVMRAAAGETRNGSANFAHAWEFVFALRTLVKKAPCAFAGREGEMVATLLVADPKVHARLAPFSSVR